jgi:hypothetical protein
MLYRIGGGFLVPNVPGPFSLLHPLNKGDRPISAGVERESIHICEYCHELFTNRLNFSWAFANNKFRRTGNVMTAQLPAGAAGSNSECVR